MASVDSDDRLLSAALAGYSFIALDFYGTLDNRIAVWALANARSLNSSTPSVRASHNRPGMGKEILFVV